MTAAAGAAALRDNGYYMDNCRRIIESRDRARDALREMGFFVTDSRTNFLFCESPDIDGERLYSELRARGILVRHFGKERIKNFNRITIGTPEQTDALLEAVADILEKEKTR
jgi:histidinol-phosphate aminotransferase